MVSVDDKQAIVANYVMYLHDFFLEDSIASVFPFVDRILIARTNTPWFGIPSDMGKTDESLEKLKKQYGNKIEIYSDDFPDEQSQRNFLLTISRQYGYRGAFIVDCDEVFLPRAFSSICSYLKSHRAKALKVPYLTFLRYANLCVSPPHETGLFYVDLTSDVQFIWARACSFEPATMQVEQPLIAHFSYIRETDEDIISKFRSFMHSGDTDWESWFEKYYLNFDTRMRNFHPVATTAWSHLITFDTGCFPQALQDKLRRTGKLYDFPGEFPAPLPPQEMHERALRLIDEEKEGKAVEELVRISGLYPAYSPAHNDLALLYYASGDKENALREFEISLKITPGNTAVLTNLANLHYESGNLQNAIDCYEAIVALTPRIPDQLVNLGNLYFLAGNKDTASSCYNRALALAPDNPGASRGISALGGNLYGTKIPPP
jgi:tetratricopeptide (TPR) repeat protein